MPPLLLGAFLLVLSWQNLGLAQLQMVEDLGIGDQAFARAGRWFWAGLLLFMMPGTLVLARLGPRRWLARLMAGWGLFTVLLALTPDATALQTLQFLLGATQAGFLPGVLLALGLILPPSHRARMIAYVMLAGVAAQLAGPPLGAWLLVGTGLRGWQLLFLATGFPALVLAAVLVSTFPEPNPPPSPKGTALRVLLDRRVLLLALQFALLTITAAGLVRVAVPAPGPAPLFWAAVGAALWAASRHRGAPAFAIALPSVLGALCVAIALLLPGARHAALTAAGACMAAAWPPFLTLPGRFLAGARAAAAIGAIGTVGGLAAAASPPLPLPALAAALLLQALLARATRPARPNPR